MKKFTTMLLLVALATTASAQVQFAGRHDAGRYLLRPQMSHRSQAPRHVLGELVTTQPEGEARQYVRSGQGLVVYDNTLFTTDQSDKTTLVYADDGKTVWIKNIVNGMSEQFGDSWVQGTLSDDGTTLTVSLEQPLAGVTSMRWACAWR